MRVFIIVLVLIFSLQSWTKADDIRDFQIEGMSIGDSLLDYFNEDEILKNDGNYGGMSFMGFYALIAVIAIELVVIVYFSIMIRRLFRDLSGEADKAFARADEPSKWLNIPCKCQFLRSFSVEPYDSSFLESFLEYVRSTFEEA
mgnify:CR=1 FL=1